MKSELRAKDYINDLAASGRYAFSLRQAQSALGGSSAATKLAIHRLAKRKLVASPARGFYVIVPPEYQRLGCLPADQFIPALMNHLDLPYYAGLLSAAQYHGAAHHRPQEFSVFLSKNRRPIKCGAVRVAFMARKRLKEIPVQAINTRRGTIWASTPEATALDLIGYADRVGGLNQVATVLSELVERIDPTKLAAAAESAPVPWAQRLGYLLEFLGFNEKAQPLQAHVRAHAKQSTRLLPKAPGKQAHRDKRWKLYVNARVEAEL